MQLDDIAFLQNPEVQAALGAMASCDPVKAALAWGKQPTFRAAVMAEQLRCRQKAYHKLAGLRIDRMLFTARSLEQSSGVIAARAKGDLYGPGPCIDITGGLGLDAFCNRPQVSELHYCERDPILAALAVYNAPQLCDQNVTIHHGDGLVHLRSRDDWDTACIDPDRRVDGRRVCGLADGEPNVFTCADLIGIHCQRLLIKAAPAVPMTDIMRLPALQHVRYVSVGGELKEVLIVCDHRHHGPWHIEAQAWNRHGELSGHFVHQAPLPFTQSLPQQNVQAGDTLLYPDVSLRRSRLTELWARSLGLSVIRAGLPLFTGSVQTSCATTFRLVNILPLQGKALRKALKQHDVSAIQYMSLSDKHPVKKLQDMLKLPFGGQQTLMAIPGQALLLERLS